MERDGGVGVFWAVVVIGGIWLTVGGGWTTVKGWLGQDVYADQRAALEGFAKTHRIGSAADVWLVKNGMAGPENVAVFFGYMDDFSACYEFAQFYMQHYPADSYQCSLAN